MDNSIIVGNFELLAKLMDINGENSFKSKTFAVAAFNIEKLPMQLKDTPREKLFSIRGIGESVGKKVIEMLDTGALEILNEPRTRVGSTAHATGPGIVAAAWTRRWHRQTGPRGVSRDRDRLRLPPKRSAASPSWCRRPPRSPAPDGAGPNCIDQRPMPIESPFDAIAPSGVRLAAGA